MSGSRANASPHSEMSTTPAQRRAEALQRAAQAKRHAATARAEAAIRRLLKNQQEINFRSVARAGGVSLDFLYANADLRRRIEALRTQQASTSQPPAARPIHAETDSNIVDALTAKLREERAARRAAVHDLEQQLTATHGEILRLRRILQQHGIHP